MKNRSNQIKKEIGITVLLYLFYFAWWYYFAYVYTDSSDVSQFKYILGLPEWFFYSCVVGLIVVNFLVYLVVRFFFKDMPLDDGDEEGPKC